ncbi:hypothetical protein ACXZ9C_11515 [Streptococcus agalactiae]
MASLRGVVAWCRVASSHRRQRWSRGVASRGVARGVVASSLVAWRRRRVAGWSAGSCACASALVGIVASSWRGGRGVASASSSSRRVASRRRRRRWSRWSVVVAWRRSVASSWRYVGRLVAGDSWRRVGRVGVRRVGVSVVASRRVGVRRALASRGRGVASWRRRRVAGVSVASRRVRRGAWRGVASSRRRVVE